MDTKELLEELEPKFTAPIEELKAKIAERPTADDTKAMEKRLGEAFKDEVKRVETELRKEIDNVNNYFKKVKETEPDDPESRAFENYLRRGVTTDLKHGDNEPPETRAAMVTTDASAGGVLVPEQMAKRIIELAVDIDPVYGLANKETVSGNSLTVPYQKTDPSAAYAGEGSVGSESEPTVGERIIHIHGIKFYSRVSEELLEDSAYDIEGFLTRRAAIQVAYTGGQDFINGSGDGEPEGVITNSDVDVLTGHDAANDNLDWEDFIQGLLSLKTQYRGNAVALVNSGTLYKVLIQDAGSTPMFQVMTQQGSFFKRIRTSETMQDDGTNGYKPLIVGDFAQGYTIVEKPKRFVVVRNPYKGDGYVYFYFRWRVGGAVVDPYAFEIVQV